MKIHPRILLTLLLLLPALACSAPARLVARLRASPTPTATATPTETPSPPPTPTPNNSTLPLTLVEREVREESADDQYRIEAVFPYLENQPENMPYNQALEQFEQSAVNQFRTDAALAAPFDAPASQSFLESRYDVLYNQRGLLSLRLWVSYYMKGAAHPGTYATTFTFDRQAGALLALDDLFLPGADFLSALAPFCQAEIAARDAAFWPDGAAADPANYRNWNLRGDGLLITFDEYQVAPYAAGPQEVLVPYSKIQPLIDLSGPLGRLLD